MAQERINVYGTEESAVAWAEHFLIAGGTLPGGDGGNAGDMAVAIKPSEESQEARNHFWESEAKQLSKFYLHCGAWVCVLLKRKKLRAILLFYQIKFPLSVQNIYAPVPFFLLELYLTVINSKYKTIFIAKMQQ